MLPTRLPAHLERQIAVASLRSPKTVRRFVAGLLVRPLCAEAIGRAMVDLGIQLPPAYASLANRKSGTPGAAP